MIHVGERAFYEEVVDRLQDCQVVLCEGVRSPTTTLLTMSYRFFADNPKLGLVLQKSVGLENLEDRLVHADVCGEAFEKRWSKLPVWSRLFRPMIAPIFGLCLRIFGTREYIARHLHLELRTSREEILSDESFKGVNEIILDWRDQHLLEVMDHELAKLAGKNACIGIVYGARHMRAVLSHLLRIHGYRVAKTEWLTVWTL